MNYHPENDMTEDEQAHWEAKAEKAGKGPGASTCSAFFEWWDDCGFRKTHPDQHAFVQHMRGGFWRHHTTAPEPGEYIVETNYGDVFKLAFNGEWERPARFNPGERVEWWILPPNSVLNNMPAGKKSEPAKD